MASIHHDAKFYADQSNVMATWQLFNLWTWRLSAILGSSKFVNLTTNLVQRSNLRHRAKFWADRSNCCEVTAVFWFFKMASVRHLEFFKVWLFNCRFERPMCITLPNFMPIGQTVVAIWYLFNFLTWRPSAILDFPKFANLTTGPVLRANLRPCAKFCADWSNWCGVMAVFRFFQDGDRLPSWILRSLKCYLPMRFQGAKLHANLSNRSGVMAVFFDFARWRPSANLVFKGWKF